MPAADRLSWGDAGAGNHAEWPSAPGSGRDRGL